MAKAIVTIQAYNDVELEIPDELLKFEKIKGKYIKSPINETARKKILELAQELIIDPNEEIVSIWDDKTDSCLYEW